MELKLFDFSYNIRERRPTSVEHRIKIIDLEGEKPNSSEGALIQRAYREFESIFDTAVEPLKLVKEEVGSINYSGKQFGYSWEESGHIVGFSPLELSVELSKMFSESLSASVVGTINFKPNNNELYETSLKINDSIVNYAGLIICDEAREKIDEFYSWVRTGEERKHELTDIL